jgi:hypothetical protein
MGISKSRRWGVSKWRVGKDKTHTQSNRMAGITTYLSVLTLNVNNLNSPNKRHRLAKWIKKQDPKVYGLWELHLTDKNKHLLSIERGGTRVSKNRQE